MRLDELEGRIIGERFHLKRMIGKGGYGAVFEAVQISVGRRCAIKILLPGRSDDESMEERFRAEARATSRLTHPNSLVLYDFGVDQETGHLFLATEFLDGVTLYDVLEEERILGVERTLRILEQMAGSLADAHRHGLVHRDIKPKNVMLIRRAGQEEFVKVIDFGIAKALFGDLANDDELTKTGMLIGTPQYMAPEQLLGTGLDDRVDQYAMAVLGYKMLTGRNPFQAASPMETAMRHVSERPLPLRTYRPELEVSAEFEDILLKALEKTPEHRHRSITAFVQALRRSWEEMKLGAPSKPGAPEVGRVTKETVKLDFDDIADFLQVDATSDSRAFEEPEGETMLLLAEPEVSKKVAPTQKLAAVTSEHRAPLEVFDVPIMGSDLVEELRGVAEFEAEEEEVAPSGESSAGPRREVMLTEREEEGTTGMMMRPKVGRGLGISPAVLVLAGASMVIVLGALGGALFIGMSRHRGVERGAKVEPVVAVGSDSEARPPGNVESPGSIGVEERPELQPVIAELNGAMVLALEAGEEAALQVAEAQRERRARRPGRVTVTLIPWGTLFIDGKERSDETRQEIRLRPGRYEFSLHQGGEEKARRLVDVEAGANKMVILEAELN